PADPGDADTDGPNGPAPMSTVLIDVPQTTGASTSADFVLSQSKKTKRIEIGTVDMACPVMLSSTSAPYVYVELKNNGAQRALMSVWTSSAGSGLSNTANALTVYPGATPPASDALRQECLGKAAYSCSSSPCNGWPGLASSDGDAVEVPANGSVIVFVQGEATKTGSFKLSVRTDFLQ
ncbi:MAG: hypothetical protein K0S65_5116, partial [Labilithrix sp.]|nr:hypothetical protein [Labilithrix sp.]